MLLLVHEICRACGTLQWATMPDDGCWMGSQCRSCDQMACEVIPNSTVFPLDPAGSHAASYAMTFPEFVLPIAADQAIDRRGLS